MHFDWWTLALQTVNVLVLFWILGRFFFRPVMDIVARRQAEAGKLLADAESARREAEAVRGNAEKARGEIEAHRDRLLAEARSAAATEKARLLAQSSQEIAGLRSEAEAAIAGSRTNATKAVIAHAQELSLDISRRLLTRFPPAVAFAGFLEGLCRAVRALPPETRSGLTNAPDGAVEVVTAAALSPEETAKVRDELGRAFDETATFRFRADPALIAGIELHGANMIVRNNWRADLEKIGEELGRDERRA